MSLSMIIILLGILFYIISCLALLDIARKKSGKLYEKAIWGFIILIPFIGCIIYFIFGYNRNRKPSANEIHNK